MNNETARQREGHRATACWSSRCLAVSLFAFPFMPASTPSAAPEGELRPHDRHGADRGAGGAAHLRGQDDQAEARDAVAGERVQREVLDDVDAGLGEAVLVHRQGQGGVGVGQHLEGHVVGADGDDARSVSQRGRHVDARGAVQVAGIVHAEMAAPAGADQGDVARLDRPAGGGQGAFEVRRGDNAARAEMIAAVEARDVEQQAAGDERRDVLDAEPGQPPVGQDLVGVGVVVEAVAFGDMAERVDMGADMGVHLDPLEIGAGVVGDAEPAPAADGVFPGGPHGHQERRLVGRHEGRVGAEGVGQVVDLGRLDAGEGGAALGLGDQVGGADLVVPAPAGAAPFAVVVGAPACRASHGSPPRRGSSRRRRGGS